MLARIAPTVAKALGSRGSVEAAKATLPGAGINALFGMLAGGPAAAAAYGVGDALINYPLIRLARRIAPPVRGKLTLETGKVVEHMTPSALEQGVNFAGSIISSPLVDLATGGRLYPRQTQATADQLQQMMALNQQQAAIPMDNAQSQQTFQELLQRHRVNNLPMGAQALAPGTMFQTQGVEQTAFHYPGMTLPPEVLEMLEG